MQLDHVPKKLKFDSLTPTPESGVGGEAAGKVFATTLLQSQFPII